MTKSQLWESKWKRFLYEDVTDETISYKEAGELFGLFHLSEEFLGEPFFTFTPRIPRNPARDWEFNVVEDDFTPRISVATSIFDALGSLEAKTGEGMHVYVLDFFKDDETEAVDLDPDECPSTPEMEYDDNFNMRQWLIHQWNKGKLPGEYAKEKNIIVPKARMKDPIRPSELPAGLDKEFQGCVPDAAQWDEYWLTSPAKMLYLGLIEKGKVYLSSVALAFLKERAPEAL